MKRKGIVLTVILVLLQLCSSLWAEPTTAYHAEKVVAGWLKADPQPLGTTLGQQVKKVETYTDESAEPLYYIVYLQPSGFVIVPADDLIEPIIGFADDGTYDPSPDNPLGALVTNDLNGRIAAVRDTSKLQAATATEMTLKHQAKWEQLVGLGEEPSAPSILAGGMPFIEDVRVAPLLQSKWAQTTCCSDPNLACYNYYTPPYEPNNPDNFPCGCVATAMAQVMRYHVHPVAGIGQHSFRIKVQSSPMWVLTRGGDGNGGPYNWDLMVYEPNCSTTGPQREAIGALCYDAGVTVLMDYNPIPFGSRALLIDVNDALIDIFMYNNAIYGSNGAQDMSPFLPDMINPNLDFNHPVILGIFPGATDGHAVVCDGYGRQYFPLLPYGGFWVSYHHLNMGWAGVQDAWYNFCNDMPPGYTIVNGCVYNIFVSGSGEIISGRVTDASRIPISDANVTAERTGGGTYNAITNDKGIYALAKIPSASTYTISVTKAGFDFDDKIVPTGTSGTGVPPNITGNVWAIDFMPAGFEGVIFVDDDASGKQDGSSWTDAYRYLQDALTVASFGDKIVVAEGTYKTDRSRANPDGTDDRNATFQLKNGVEIYGGFPDGGCNSWAERDPTTNETILSGDVGPVGGGFGACTGYSFHVITGSGTNSTAILDGFTITKGKACYPFSPGPPYSPPDQTGGGMYNVNSSPTVSNCKFSENDAQGYGGGMYNENSSPTLTNCIFRDNYASINGSKGCAIYNDNSNPVINNCTFNWNVWGWSIHAENNCSLTLNNCTIVHNAGGMRLENNSSANVNNTIIAFSSDKSVNVGAVGCSVTFICCDIFGNGKGDWISPFAGQLGTNGNICENPMFCDADYEDYSLKYRSPCLPFSPPNEECDLIGAWPLGCLPGDMDKDWDVDFPDYAIFALAWFTEPGDDNWNRYCDINIPADDFIGALDLDVLTQNWLVDIK